MPTQERHTPIQQLKKEVNILTTKITQQQIAAQESKAQLQQLLEKIQQPNIDYNEIKTQIDEQFVKYNQSLLNQYQVLVDATKTSQKAELVSIAKEIKQQLIQEVLAVKTEKDLFIKKHLDDYKLTDETIKTRVDALTTVAEDLTLKIKELKSLNTDITKQITDFGQINLKLHSIEDQIDRLSQTSIKQNALLDGIENIDNERWWETGDAEAWVANYITKVEDHHENSKEINQKLSTIVEDVKNLLNDGLQNIKQSVEINMQSQPLQDQDQQQKYDVITSKLQNQIQEFTQSYSEQTQKIHDLVQQQVKNQQSLQVVAQFIKDTLTQELNVDDANDADADAEMDQSNRVVGIKKMLDEALIKSTNTIKTYTQNLVQIYQQALTGSQEAIKTFQEEQDKYIQQHAFNQTTINEVINKLEADQKEYQAIKKGYIDYGAQFQTKTSELLEQRKQDAAQYSEQLSAMRSENQKTYDMIYGNKQTNVIGLFQIVEQAHELLGQAQRKIDEQLEQNKRQKKQVNQLMQAMIKLNEQYTLLMDQTATDIITKMGKKLANELEKQLNDKIDAILSDRKRDLKRLSFKTKPMIDNFIQEEDVEEEVIDITDQTGSGQIGRGRSFKIKDEIPLRSYSPALDYFRSKLDSKIMLSTAINRYRIDIYCYTDVDSFLQEQSQHIQTVIEVNLDQTNFPYRFRQYVTTPVLGMALNHKNNDMLYVLVAILPKALFFLETIGTCDTTFSPQMQAILLGSNTNVQLFVGQLNSTNGKNTARFVQTEGLSSSFGRPLNEGGLCIRVTDMQYLEAIAKRNEQPRYKLAFNMYVAVNHVRCFNMSQTLEYISQKDIAKQVNEADGKSYDDNN